MNDRPIHHVCYIVDDIPEAVDQWVEATGAGPFFHLGEHVEFDETLLEGEPCVLDHASAIGKWGPIFLELIEPHEVTPELESRFYTGGAGGSNIAHIAYIVDDPAAESERLEAAGMPKFLHLRQGPIQISLHDAPLLGHAIEVHRTPTRSTGCSRCSRLGLRGGMGASRCGRCRRGKSPPCMECEIPPRRATRPSSRRV
jgi:catechol 2,3-dioxygenase-like lactoylglutathione lyase family enzyme